jgi:predicted metal-dependent HD superfamily phosphohydrolase
MNFEGAKKFLLDKLARELDPRLTYHSLSHTLDVLESATRLAKMEGLGDHETKILQTAAVFHDCGMLKTYRGHEIASVEIAESVLPSYSYSQEEIDEITKMILATQIPQSAKNKIDQILCDADLDYLGRNDFFMVAHQLKYEWEAMGIFPTSLVQWYEIQIDFLSQHDYFTDSARAMRQEKKLKNLEEIRLLFNNEK